MGIFDESSDEDEKEDGINENTKSDGMINNEKEEQTEDDEDPLDAYMNSLQQSIRTNDDAVMRKHSHDNDDDNDSLDHKNDSTCYQNKTIITKISKSRYDNDLDNDDTDSDRIHDDSIIDNSHYYHHNDDDDDDDDDNDDDKYIYNVDSEEQRQEQRRRQPTSINSSQLYLQNTFRSSSNNNNNDMNRNHHHHHHEQQQPQQSRACVVQIQKKFWDGDDTILGQTWRTDHNVTINIQQQHRDRTVTNTSNNKGRMNMDPILQFQSIQHIFGESLYNEIVHVQKYTSPTIVQSQSLPILLSGYNTIITAATGQGKTMTYIWPICVHLRYNYHRLLQEDQQHVNTTNSYNNNKSREIMGPIALVLVPTRELAIQVQKHAKPMLHATTIVTSTAAVSDTQTIEQQKQQQQQQQQQQEEEHVPLRSRAVIGGQGKYMLVQELKKTGGIDLVIATPGRLLDVISSSTTTTSTTTNPDNGKVNSNSNKGLSLHRVSMIVLDEADKMLHMGFEQQVNDILHHIPNVVNAQIIMLSATMNARIEKIAYRWLLPLSSDSTATANITSNTTSTSSLTTAVRISVGRTGQISSNHIDQQIIVLPNERAKEAFIIEMLPILHTIGRTIIFVATRIKCEQLAEVVRQRVSIPTSSTASSNTDISPVATLHGDKHQTDRTTAVRNFTKGMISILIATDVAARGLDIPNVQTVISYDAAKNLDHHIHRIGRTGRLSKDTNESNDGTAYTLLLESSTSDADFARVLVDALQKDNKSISPELEQLAKKSRRKNHFNNVIHNQNNNHHTLDNSRSILSKTGLGYVEGGGRGARDVNVNVTSSYSNSIVGTAPPPKRFRNI